VESPCPIEWRDLTGGASGLAGISRAVSAPAATALLACGFCALALIGFQMFRPPQAPPRPRHAGRTRVGAGPAARSIGISPFAGCARWAFVLAAAMAGTCRRIAGGADRLHRAELIFRLLALDPVSSGRGRRRRRPQPWGR